MAFNVDDLAFCAIAGTYPAPDRQVRYEAEISGSVSDGRFTGFVTNSPDRRVIFFTDGACYRTLREEIDGWLKRRIGHTFAWR